MAFFLKITGKVQGVGFRPHVYKLAQKFGLSGWVRNTHGCVQVHIQGSIDNIATFIHQVIDTAPILASPKLISCTEIPNESLNDFTIRASISTNESLIYLPLDIAMCDECTTELNDPVNRRYRYSFINCTQCGPRYTIIQKLPYDRAVTTMVQFELCPNCYQEYIDPSNRRFHAEPIACANCGPSLQFHFNNDTNEYYNEMALEKCKIAIQNGLIVAIRGIGGYHLCCRANDDAVIKKLRARKFRPHKPLAVMFPVSLSQPFNVIERYVCLSHSAKQLLLSPIHPIVLATCKTDYTLSSLINPGLNELGVLLPYSPLHYILLNELQQPLIITSANLSGEPIFTEPSEIESNLNHVAEAFLHHNRPILKPVDDPIYAYIGKKFRPLRLGRGNAPLELTLSKRLSQPVLAVGSHAKNTIALAWDDRIVISPHIGDLHTARSLEIFERTIVDLQKLYGVTAKLVLCDAHPGYASTRWAKQCGLPVQTIFHHHAHAAAVYGDTGGSGEWLVFTWDGTGYGINGQIHGGEAWIGQPGAWQHFASMRPFFLPGGDRASVEPWRSAAALCWETGYELTKLPPGAELVRQAWQRKLNVHASSAMGKIFDAAAAILGICQHASFDGQAPMLLEAVCAGETLPLQLPLVQSATEIWLSDWEPLLPMLLNQSLSIQFRATCFHFTMSHCILQQALLARNLYNIKHVGLSGGVFQNRVLTDATLELLTANNFDVAIPVNVPINDAGISYGQVIEILI